MKDKLYDAWLHWNLTKVCNLNCTYCPTKSKKTKGISKIDIRPLMNTLEKTNKIFKISFTGEGEPFLVPNLIEACEEITKKHYISINTNLTSNRVKEFSEKIDPDKVTYIGASLHIKELDRLNLTDKYISNFLLLKEKGFNVFADVVAYPALSDEIERYKKFFKERGIEIKFSPFQGTYSDKKYPESYTEKELRVFNLDKESVKIYENKDKICNAGYNMGVVWHNGNIRYCFQINTNIGNIYKEIKFTNRIFRCPVEFCECPLNKFDNYLFEKALKEAKMNEFRK